MTTIATAGIHPIKASPLQARRERVFLVLAAVFIGAMAILKIIGITRFIHIGPLAPVPGRVVLHVSAALLDTVPFYRSLEIDTLAGHRENRETT